MSFEFLLMDQYTQEDSISVDFCIDREQANRYEFGNYLDLLKIKKLK